MTWLRRQTDTVLPEHHCDVPMRDVMVRLPVGRAVDTPPGRPVKVDIEPDGRVGDVWACDGCSAVWRVALPEHLGGRHPAGGYVPRGRNRWLRLSRRKARRAVAKALT